MAKSENMQRINLEVDRNRTTSENFENVPKSADPYSSEIEKAQKMLEELRLKKEQQQRDEERKQVIESKRAEFTHFRNEVLDQLEATIPNIDQELLGAKQEISDLEDAKKHFQANLKTVEAINPERWDDDAVIEQADKFQSVLSKTAREYDQFSSILAEGRGGKVQSLTSKSLAPVNNFKRDLMRGFAFSLPLIITLVALFLLFK